MIIILFGKAGSGKTFAGHLLAEFFDFYFWDSEAHFPDEIRDQIKEKKLFTQSMRDQITQQTIDAISKLHPHHPCLAIGNALLKEKNRLQLLTVFPDAIFIYIKADAQTIATRLKKRSQGIEPSYAININALFEEPQLSHFVIYNDSDKAEIIKQFKIII